MDEANLEEEMHRIIGGKQQQGSAHNSPGTQVVPENRLVGSSGQDEVGPEEEHQRQCHTKRIPINQMTHFADFRIFGR